MKAYIDYYCYVFCLFPFVFFATGGLFALAFLFTNLPVELIEGLCAMLLLTGYCLCLIFCGILKYSFNIWVNDFGIMSKRRWGNKMIAWEEIARVRVLSLGPADLLKIYGRNGVNIYMPRYLDNSGILMAYLTRVGGPDLLFSNFFHGNFEFFENITPEMLESTKVTDFDFNDWREDRT